MNSRTEGTILVGVDGSSNSAVAAAWAAETGQRMNMSVRAVTAWTLLPPDSGYGFNDPVSEMHEAAADDTSRFLREAGLDGIEVLAVRGPAAEALLETADSLDASVLVVGTRGLGPLSGLLLGSVSRRLLFRTRRPLVVVPCRRHLSPPALTRILVGVDCSTVAKRVLSWSAAFCASLGVPATIVRCTDPGCEKPPGHVASVDDTLRGDTEEAMEAFRADGVAYDVVITHSDPRSALLDIAANTDAGLIVVGRRGEGQFRGLGGTTSYLVRHSPIPLAVIP